MLNAPYYTLIKIHDSVATAFFCRSKNIRFISMPSIGSAEANGEIGVIVSGQ
jgi:hypothetical protein